MAKRAPPDPHVQRAADVLQESWTKHDVRIVTNWLSTLGCRVAVDHEGTIALDGLVDGMRVGFSEGLDPVTLAVQVGFALAGPYWPHAFPGLLPEVNRRWKAAMKAAKAAS